MKKITIVRYAAVFLAFSLTACGSGSGGGNAPIVDQQEDSPQSSPESDPVVSQPPLQENPPILDEETILGLGIGQLNDIIGGPAPVGIPLDLKVFACISEDSEKCEETPVMDDHAPNGYHIQMGRSLHAPGGSDLDLTVETRLVFSTVSGATAWGQYVPVLYQSKGGILEVLKVGRVMTANSTGQLATKTMFNFDGRLGVDIIFYGIEGFGVALLAVDEDDVNSNLVKVEQSELVSIEGTFKDWSSSSSDNIELSLVTSGGGTKAYVEVCEQIVGQELTATSYSWRRISSGAVLRTQLSLRGTRVLEDGCAQFVIDDQIIGYGNSFSVIGGQGYPRVTF